MLCICNTKGSLKPHLYSSSFSLWNQITENPLLLSQFLCIPTVVIPLHTMLRIYTYMYVYIYMHVFSLKFPLSSLNTFSAYSALPLKNRLK